MIKTLAMIFGIALSPANNSTQTVHSGIVGKDNWDNIVYNVNKTDPGINLITDKNLMISAIHNGAKVLQNDHIFTSDQGFLNIKNIYIDEAKPITNDGWGLYWVSGSYLDPRTMDYKNYYGQLKLNEQHPNEITAIPSGYSGKINYGIFPRYLHESALPKDNYNNIWASYAEFYLKWINQANSDSSKSPIIGARFKPLQPTKDGYMQTDATILYVNPKDSGRISTLKTHMVYDFWNPNRSKIISISQYMVLPWIPPKSEFDGSQGITKWTVKWYGLGHLYLSKPVVESIFHAIDLANHINDLGTFVSAYAFLVNNSANILAALSMMAAAASGIVLAASAAITFIIKVLPLILLVIIIAIVIIAIKDWKWSKLAKYPKGIKATTFGTNIFWPSAQ